MKELLPIIIDGIVRILSLGLFNRKRKRKNKKNEQDSPQQPEL